MNIKFLCIVFSVGCAATPYVRTRAREDYVWSCMEIMGGSKEKCEEWAMNNY